MLLSAANADEQQQQLLLDCNGYGIVALAESRWCYWLVAVGRNCETGFSAGDSHGDVTL